MFIKKAIVLALFALFSNESFAATPIVRASAIQAGPAKSVTSPASNRAPIQGVTSGSLNKLHSNRVQVSTTPSTTPSTGVSDKVLDSLYEEVQKVQDSFEEEIRYTRQQIMDLKEEIAEKDEKIADLEKSLKEYEEIKETVKEIPNMYYSKRELEAKNFATKGDLEKVEFDRSAVVSLIDNRLATKKIVSEESLPKLDAFVQVKNTIAAIPKTYATAQYVDAAVNKETTARETGLTGLRDTLTQKIDNESTARANALSAEAAQRTAEISNLGNKYATIQNVDTKINEINDNIADDLLKNDNFKTQVLAGLSDDIKTLPNTVNNLTNKVNIIEGTFAKAEDLNNYVKTTDLGSQVAELDEFEQVQQTVAAIPNIYAKTSDVTTAISNEATARANALSAETAARDTQMANLRDTLTQKIDDETAARKTALIAETSARENDVSGLHTTLSKKIDDESTARTNEINRLGNTYATIDNVNNKFSNISDTIASDLLKNDDFKGQVLADLSDDIKNLPTTVTNLQNRLDEFDGKFVKIIDFDGKFDTRFDGIFADKIQNNDWLKKIRDDVDDFDSKFVKIDGFDDNFNNKFDGRFDDKIKIFDDKFVKVIDFNGKVQDNEWLQKIRGDVDALDGKFVRVTDFDDKVKNNDWLKTLRGDVDAFNGTFAKKDDLPTLLDGTFIRPTALTEYVKDADLGSKVAALESFAGLRNRLDGFETTFAKKDELDTLLDGKFARPAVLANYLKTADLGDEIVKIDTFTTINNRLDGLDSKFTNIGDTVAAELDGVYVKPYDLDKMSDELDAKFIKADALAPYLKTADLGDKVSGLEIITGLDTKFIKADALTPYLKTADLGTKVAALDTITTIQSDIAGMDSKFAKPADINSAIAGLDSVYLKPVALNDYTKTADLTGVLGTTFAKPADIDTAIAGLDTKFVKPADLTKYATTEGLNSAIAGLGTTYAKQADVTTLLNAYTPTSELVTTLEDTFPRRTEIGSFVSNELSNYTPTANLNTVVAALPSVTNLRTQVNDIPNVYAKSEDVASELTELENSINSVNTNLGNRITNLNTTVGSLGNVVNSHTTTLSDQADTLTLHTNVLTNHEDVLADHEDVLENHESAISTANSNITLLNTNVTKLNTGELTLETTRLPVTALKPTVSLTPIISLDP